ncbi:MAG: BspA family leucine-rich repeat surface protein, partial [Spirochaetota bacterium]
GKVWEVRAWGEMFANSGLASSTGKQPSWRQVFAEVPQGASKSCGATVRTQRPATKAALITAIGTSNHNGTNSLAYIDTSGVTNMSSLFENKKTFNGTISCWDVSAVTGDAKSHSGSAIKGMQAMFNGAVAFNQDIGGWDTGKVVSMVSMFLQATAFNNGGSDSIQDWNTAKVQGMDYMFQDASAFDQPLNWDVSSVTLMTEMFSRARAFNQNIGGWDVSKVLKMEGMFEGASKFNQNIGSWNVGSVTTMAAMFNGATAFNQDLSDWESTLSSTLKNTKPTSIFASSGMACSGSTDEKNKAKAKWPSSWQSSCS